MSELTTNFNTSPYNDDYDSDKKFYRILFIPSVAVQVRELTQIQTIIQHQIQRFGDHVFKDGSIVDGCNITHIPDMQYVRVNNSFGTANNNNAFDETLQDYLAVSSTYGTRASIRLVQSGYQLQYPNTNTLYVDYIRTGRDGSNNEVTTFQSGETLTIYNDTQNKLATTLDSGKIYNTINVFTANVAANQSSTGTTYAVTVGEGIVYQKGFFVNVSPHTIVVTPYSTDVDEYLVGFNTQEEIVTHLQDSSLIDPADTSSRNGVGAHRLKLEPILVSIKRSDLTEDSEFFPIIEFSGNKPAFQNIDPEYAKLGDYLAGEKYAESGDFYVKPFIVTTENSSNTATFNYVVNPGLGWIKGNKVDLLSTKRIEADRATETEDSNANIVTLNYGYYVEVDEVTGIFNHDALDVVTLYDTAQNSITDAEGSGSAPSGNSVGTANIRNVVYDRGTKGVANCVFRAYLTNISMDSGKSFSTDVKSLFANSATFGPAKADIVLSDGKAVIHDSGRSSLIFDTSIEGLKRLRDSGGVNDTQFYLRDISSATLQSNGFVTFTLNTPHAGGTERFFSSAGALSAANEDRIDVYLSAAAYTTSLTGNVSTTTSGAGNTTLTGYGTLFDVDFEAGDLCRISANSSNHLIRTVVSVTSNTSMVIDSPIAIANTEAKIAKYWPAGSVLDLSGDATTTAISNTQFSVDMSVTLDSGSQTVYASYPVLRTEAVEAKKNAKKSRYVKINCNTNSGGILGPWNLGLCDVYAIEGVYVGSTYDEANPERSAWFTLDNGQQSDQYNHARLFLKPAYAANITTATRILVKLSYFEHSVTSGIGFFAVDSYPVRDPGVAANTTNVSYAEIPNFNGKNLRNCIDFRPARFNTAADSATIGGATEDPVAANTSFNVSASGTYLPEPDSNFQADVEYYLPRIDLVQVNKEGVFIAKSSVPSVRPKTPIVNQDSMAIASVYVPPYPSLTSTEKNSYPGKNKIEVKIRGNRGYTMKDINAIDQRVTRLEWQTTLNLLENQAKDLSVRDENGLDRFKSGIFADPLNNHLLGDYTNFEYSIAIDPIESLARPKVKTTPIDLKIASKANTTASGSVVTLNYTANTYITQPYASKYRNVTESVWRWNGNLALFPSYDHFRDQQTTPDVNIAIDLATPWDQFASTPFGADFGDWRVVSRDVLDRQTTSFNSGSATVFTTSTTTQTTQQRDVERLSVSTSLSTQNLGSYITDITMNPFIRSREVALIATGLKPFTKFHVFFDKTNVDEHCAPAALSGSFDADTGTATIEEGSESAVLVRSDAWGSDLVSDDDGNLYVMLRIPAGTFHTGDREVLIANVDDLETGGDAITSASRATYVASSLSTTSNDINLTTINPTISSVRTTESLVSTATSVTRRVVDNRPPNEPWPPDSGGNGVGDPLGQSFVVEVPAEIPGIFLDKIGVYFKAKDPSLGITCFVVEVTAGVPDTNKILARSYLKPSEVNTSDDASLETVFNFTNIPYLNAGKYYAFFLQPDGNSPEYLIYMAEIGGTDLSTGLKIFSNPYIGVAYTSANSNTWNALQKEDVKFNLYRCEFSPLTGTVTLTDQDDEYLTVNGFTLANSQLSVQIGDVVYSQNTSGDIQTGNTDPVGVVQLVDVANDLLVLDGSNGLFAANTVLQIHRPAQAGNVAALSSNTLIANTTIISIDDVDYSMVVPRIGHVTPFGTAVAFRYKGMDSSETEDANWRLVQPEYETEMVDKMRTIKSASNRSGSHTVQFQLTLSSPSSFLTPVIDLKRRSALVIENIINNDITDEHTRYGAALTKQISRTITLKEGLDAEDLRVIISGYRPADTNIYCYAKFKNAEDPDVFEDKYWTLMTMSEGSTIYSNALDVSDFREYVWTVPTTEAQQGEAYLNADNDNIIQYRNAAGSVYQGYKMFALKFVLVSSRPELVPRIRDIQALALQI